jgi:hypothetical protein
MRITISIASFGRPQRTRRMINAVCNQNIDGWEALIVGDGCPVIDKIIKSGEFDEIQAEMEMRGNRLIIENLEKNYGGCGYEIINRNIQRAEGRYFVLGANDDIILPNHFENYLSGIENSEFDFVYYNSYVEPYKSIRDSQLMYAHIGHSELIVKTEYAKKMPPHSPEYGHDWIFIENLMKGGGSSRKVVLEPTYIVKSVPVLREQGID